MGSKSNGFGSFFTGLLIGGFVGSLVALVTAPQSGDQTRDQIRNKSLELKEKTEQTVDEALTTLQQASSEISEQAALLQSHHKEMLNDSKRLWKQSIDEITKITREALDEMKAAPAKTTQEEVVEAVDEIVN